MRKLRKQLFRRVGGKRRGFTLIELLIVLTILAILVAVVTIALTTFIGKGEQEACETDQRSLQQAVFLFHTQGGDWPTNDGAPGRIDYTDASWPDSFGNRFVNTYILEKPDSDDDCLWTIYDDGMVFVPTLNLDTCPCCEITDVGPPEVWNHTWCGTP